MRIIYNFIETLTRELKLKRLARVEQKWKGLVWEISQWAKGLSWENLNRDYSTYWFGDFKDIKRMW